MSDDNVVDFPGTPIQGAELDYELHWTLAEALRESARHGFDRKLKGLWARYALSGWKENPMALPDFLDCALLMAREQRYLNALPWKDAFQHVLQIVTSKPEPNRSEGIAWIKVYNEEFETEILARLANLPNPRSHKGT